MLFVLGANIVIIEKMASGHQVPNAVYLVIPLGFEPKTHSLEGCCSIQLSYGTIIFAWQR